MSEGTESDRKQSIDCVYAFTGWGVKTKKLTEVLKEDQNNNPNRERVHLGREFAEDDEAEDQVNGCEGGDGDEGEAGQEGIVCE
jgi:hypothetical protein